MTPRRPSSTPRAGAALALLLGAALSGSILAGPLAAQASEEEQIARAVLAAPEHLRATARVLGYRDGTLTVLREGGPMVCLADDPADSRFHVACYHESLEPYMARGRELKAEGVGRRESIAKRWEEIEAGSLVMPEVAALFSLSSREGADGSGEDPDDLFRLTVLYVPYATVEETGLPADPSQGLPWLMFPGRPTAHVMIHEPMP